MGKIKVSFTTALFAFSFLVCVIVAVIFVDRSPKNDFDAFYDQTAGDAAANKGRGQASSWDSSAPTPTPVTVPPEPTPVNVEALLADLPVDGPGGQAPLPATVTPTPLHNPMSGRTPEEIARAYMNKAGVQASAQAAATVPGMAVPEGIGTPALPQADAGVAPGATPQARREYLPLQSNAQGNAPGMMPSANSGYRGRGNGNSYPGDSFTNAGSMSPMMAPGQNSNLIGVHKVPGASQSGMMVGAHHVESGAQPPPGFVDAPQAGGTVSLPSLQGSGAADPRSAPAAGGQSAPTTALPGSAEKPLLFPPQGGPAGNKYELPPAPTLRPPIQDPDRRRSEADMTPGSLNPDEESGQAFLISGAEGEQTLTENADDAAQIAAASELPAPVGEPVEAEENADTAAQVNDVILKKDEAVRLARVAFKLKDKKLARSDEEKEAAKAAEEWKQIQASAQLARMEGLSVGAPDVEHYAALRPDFEPALWQIAMEEEGFKTPEIRKKLESIALSERLIETKFEKDVEEDAIRKAYDKTPSRFASPKRYRLQEILKKKPAEKERAERVEREIKRLQKQAAGGTDFSLLARQASDAPTAKRGGNLGWVDPSKNKDAARDKALEGLHAGDVTEVLEDDDGYRIYRLAEVKEAAKDFDSAKENVIADLKKPVREAQYAEALKKLDAGELKGSEPVVVAEKPSATAAKQATPVVSTRVGSSLAQRLAEEPAEPAPAAAQPAPEAAAVVQATGKAPAKQKLDGNRAKQTAQQDAPDDMQKKFLAQELLGEAAARRQAEERGEVFISNRELQQQQGAPTTQEHNPAQQAQLLYAPGTQVQQFEGAPAAGAPAAAGFAPVQMQDNMQMPNSAVVSYDSSVAVPPADPAQQQQAAQAQAAAQANPYQMPQQTQSESNGWTVVKTRRERQAASPPQVAGPGADPMMDAQMQPQAQAGQAMEGGVPPGFEGGAAPAPQQQQQPRRGIVGGVKNFFGSFGRP